MNDFMIMNDFTGEGFVLSLMFTLCCVCVGFSKLQRCFSAALFFSKLIFVENREIPEIY